MNIIETTDFSNPSLKVTMEMLECSNKKAVIKVTRADGTYPDISWNRDLVESWILSKFRTLNESISNINLSYGSFVESYGDGLSEVYIIYF